MGISPTELDKNPETAKPPKQQAPGTLETSGGDGKMSQHKIVHSIT